MHQSMKDLIKTIKQTIANGTNQLHNVTRVDYTNLNELEAKGYIRYMGFNNAPDIVDIEKGENYDQL